MSALNPKLFKTLQYEHFFYVLRGLNLIMLGLMLLALLFVARTISLSDELKRAENSWYQAVMLGTELRDSSDHLTMMARVYAVTGKERFKDYFYRISDIREGLAPTPKDYDSIYWTFLMPDGQVLPEAEGVSQSLLARVAAIGLTDDEINLLKKAKNNSVNLIQTEIEAFDLMTKGEQQKSIDLLFSNDFFERKIKIMQPVKAFMQVLEKRTKAEREHVRSEYDFYFYSVYGLFAVFFLMVFFRFLTEKAMQNNVIYLLNQKVDEKTQKLSESNQQLIDTLEDLNIAHSKLVEFERANLINRLIPGVAHEINTPTGVAITASSSQLSQLKSFREQLDKNEVLQADWMTFLDEMQEMSELVYKNMNKLSKMVAVFKRLSVEQQGDQELASMINLHDTVEACIQAIMVSKGNKLIKIENNIEQGIEIATYPLSVTQVFTELISNAVKHAFEQNLEGTIRIDSDCQESDLVIKVTDNGDGMDRETRSRIYTPFFSTNRVDGNLGLGMNVVYNLVRQKLGGDIECRSTVGKGTVFTITLQRWNYDAFSASDH